jgi:hypothetical protein
MAGLSIPFSLFDFFAVLLPGVVTTFSLYLAINPLLSQSRHTQLVTTTVIGSFSGELFALAIFVIWCYLLGYAVTNFSQHLIEKPYKFLGRQGPTAIFDRVHAAYESNKAKSKQSTSSNWKSNAEDAFAAMVAHFAKERFGEGLSVRELFTLCLSVLTENAPANRAGIQIAVVTSQMFQGLALAFLIAFVVVIARVIPIASYPLSWSLLVASVLFFISSAYGYGHYKRIYYGSVFGAYVAYEAEQRRKEKKGSQQK